MGRTIKEFNTVLNIMNEPRCFSSGCQSSLPSSILGPVENSFPFGDVPATTDVYLILFNNDNIGKPVSAGGNIALNPTNRNPSR